MNKILVSNSYIIRLLSNRVTANGLHPLVNKHSRYTRMYTSVVGLYQACYAYLLVVDRVQGEDRTVYADSNESGKLVKIFTFNDENPFEQQEEFEVALKVYERQCKIDKLFV